MFITRNFTNYFTPLDSLRITHAGLLAHRLAHFVLVWERDLSDYKRKANPKSRIGIDYLKSALSHLNRFQSRGLLIT